MWNFDVDVAIEPVARNVDLGRAHVRDGTIKSTCGDLGHALLVVDLTLVLGELFEHRKLVGFLETAQADSARAGLRSDDDDRRVRPERCGDSGDTVGNTGTVLPDHDAMATRHSGVTVGHVRGTLLVHDRDETNAGRSKDIHGVHKRRAHDAKGGIHLIGHERLNKCLTWRHAGHRNPPQFPGGARRALRAALRLYLLTASIPYRGMGILHLAVRALRPTTHHLMA